MTRVRSRRKKYSKKQFSEIFWSFGCFGVYGFFGRNAVRSNLIEKQFKMYMTVLTDVQVTLIRQQLQGPFNSACTRPLEPVHSSAVVVAPSFMISRTRPALLFVCFCTSSAGSAGQAMTSACTHLHHSGIGRHSSGAASCTTQTNDEELHHLNVLKWCRCIEWTLSFYCHSK